MKILENQIKNTISGYTNISNISNDHYLNEDLDIDSLGVLELFLSLEDEYEIIIDPDDAERLDTVQKIIDYISSCKII